MSLPVVLAGPAQAHFNLSTNIRVVHVQHLDEGLRVYLRLPAPYVLAWLVGEAQADGSVAPAPYTDNRQGPEQLLHFIDFEAFAADPEGLGRLVEQGHDFAAGGRRLAGRVEQVTLHRALEQPPFATLEEAMAAVGEGAGPEDGELPVGETVVDVVLRYAAEGSLGAYDLSSTLDPGLEGQDETANLILDHYPGETLVFRKQGLLAEPVAVRRSPLAAAWTFVYEGIRHILEGTDHVLFVLCMALGAATLSDILWRVTGFTVGHSLTLMLGILGYVPAAPWFVPAVESGIALSIIYAGGIAVLAGGGRGRFVLPVTTALGLLHGLGFSFVLNDILRGDSPHLWVSLLSFNLGVEVGQVAIVLVALPPLWWISRRWTKLGEGLRWAVALPCIALATFWTGERVRVLIDLL